MTKPYDFGERLKRLRLEKSLSQPQIAIRIGVSKTVISNYENNYKLPSTENLIKLARLFGTSTDYLLGFDHELVIDLQGLNDEQKSFMKEQVNSWKSILVKNNLQNSDDTQ